MSRPRLSRIDSWGNYEARVLKVIVLALEILRSKNPNLTEENEDQLNYELYFCMLEAVRRLGGSESGIESPPVYDCINQPLEDEGHLDVARKKRPDFLWGYIDHTEPDPRRSARHYYVECKRLGAPARSDWVFNKNYVINGVLRFIQREWNYGRASSSGTMIGYVQSMAGDSILVEVNEELRNSGVREIRISCEGWQGEGVSNLEHKLDRKQIVPPSFTLRHYWVDLRVAD